MSGIYDYIVQSFPYTLSSKINDKTNEKLKTNTEIFNSHDNLSTNKTTESEDIKTFNYSKDLKKSISYTINYMIEDTTFIFLDLVA